MIGVSESSADNSVTFSPLRMNGVMTFVVTTDETPPTSAYIAISRHGTGAVVYKLRRLQKGRYAVRLSPVDEEKCVALIETPDDVTEAELGSQLRSVNDRAESIESSTAALAMETAEMERRVAELTERENSLGIRKILLGSEIGLLKTKIGDLEAEIQRLDAEKEGLNTRLGILQEECGKDYSRFEDEIDEIRARYDVDARVLSYYKDREARPVEEMIAKAEAHLNELEEQIRVFAEVRRKEAADLEKELQVGGRP
jgi:chromosome segregation ATPase